MKIIMKSGHQVISSYSLQMSLISKRSVIQSFPVLPSVCLFSVFMREGKGVYKVRKMPSSG